MNRKTDPCVAVLRQSWAAQRAAFHATLGYEPFLPAWVRVALDAFGFGAFAHRRNADHIEDELKRLGGWEDGW